jgi:hypothetical protein
MAPLSTYVEEAIAHEAGHIVVAYEFGIKIDELYVMLTRTDEGLKVGDFATLAEDPPAAEIPKMSEELKTAFQLFVAGGVAGNKFNGLEEISPGAVSDREELKRYTQESLEEVSETALLIVQERRRVFRRIVSVARQRLRDLTKDPQLPTGRYTLLNERDLAAIFAKE